MGVHVLRDRPSAALTKWPCEPSCIAIARTWGLIFMLQVIMLVSQHDIRADHARIAIGIPIELYSFM